MRFILAYFNLLVDFQILLLVENSYVTFPKFIGMGYEKKEKLSDLLKKLFN